MPNAIAYLALALWPLLMFVFFKRLPVGRALILSFLGAYLLLPPQPAAFDFPLLPPLNKDTLPNVVALLLVIFVVRERVQFLPRSKVGIALVAAFIFSPVFTIFTNGEPLIFANNSLRGLYERDIVALIFTQTLILVGFVLARQFLGNREGLRDLLFVFLVSGLIYSFPMLLEVRLSPQLNVWIYGYFPHVFEQVIRAGGYRATVFLSHGIWAAIFIMMALASAIILWRNSPKGGRSWFFIAAIFLGFVLVLNKTLGPVVYATLFVILVLFTGWKFQARVAVVMAALVLIYPLAKSINAVPEERILAVASAASEERSNSLRFRFDNENILLDRAMEKPLFGWGTWGRNHVHDAFSGEITTVSDGRWVITIGVYGWLGFLAEFGLLTLPIFMFAYHSSASQRADQQRWRQSVSNEIPVKKQLEDRIARYVPSPIGGSLALLLAVNVADLIPNATLTPMTWLIAGALLGYAEKIADKTDNNMQVRPKPTLSDSSNRIELPKGPRTIL
ncbi:hypothetical protein [Cognatishimia activa]|uniref:Lipid A core-O-antigen ligase n=1 Tax=Cognatishimia activa TaxID=1715691 RepID=A0A0P1IN61_9RHOB|nr:hypothetical protein [Cognatishimia activa]MEE2945173.1 hypothetical protein [Pseudomonadota bacterium]CUJ13247.1 Lipid A core-O-antigen ligase [Cognatishimia activa]CUK24955.1 Lipid A core-O-antigen ligase [Cognatishimia activa]